MGKPVQTGEAGSRKKLARVSRAWIDPLQQGVPEFDAMGGVIDLEDKSWRE